MPKVFFMIPDDSGDGKNLSGAATEVESVPRVGERVSMYGPQFGDRHADVTVFVVESVLYQYSSVLGVQPRDVSALEESECPNVWLREEDPVVTFRPKCTCGPKRKADETDPNRCDECGDRIP